MGSIMAAIETAGVAAALVGRGGSGSGNHGYSDKVGSGTPWW